MEELKVEYLIIIDTENSFCDSKKAFNNLLSSHSNIFINGDKVKYLDLEFNYELQTNKYEDSKQRLFHLKLINKNIDKIEEFALLLKAIRGTLSKATNNKPIQKIWDDISKYYSLAAYPIIHDVENLMRKLITKFMLTNVGQGWIKEAVPEEIKKSSRSKPKDSNYLYEIDFIQLSDILFLRYSIVETKVIFEKINSSKKLSELDLEELKKYLPASNWERYFSPIVDCEDAYLEKRWAQLYEYRCKIAHNNDFNKTDYENTVKLSEDIKPKLSKAIENLDKIKLSSEEKEFIAENIAGNFSEFYGVFLNKGKVVTSLLYSILERNKYLLDNAQKNIRYKYFRYEKIEEYKHRPVQMAGGLAEHGIISSFEFSRIHRLNLIRNQIIHDLEINISDLELKQWIADLDDLIDYLSNKV